MNYFERPILVIKYEAVKDQTSLIEYYKTTALSLYCIESSVHTSMANVATKYTHHDQGKAAEELQTGAKEDFKRKFGADCSDS